MRRLLVVGCLVLLAGCAGEREQEVRREGAPLPDAVPVDSTPARGDSMMARDTATPK